MVLVKLQTFLEKNMCKQYFDEICMLLVICRSRSVEECAITFSKITSFWPRYTGGMNRGEHCPISTLARIHCFIIKNPVTITKKMCWWPHLEIRPARLLIPRGSSTLRPLRYTSISFWRPHLWNKYAHFNIYPESLLSSLCKILQPLKEICYCSDLFQ